MMINKFKPGLLLLLTVIDSLKPTLPRFPDDEPLGGIESEEEADVAVAACVARAGVAPPLARLTDMRPAQAHDTRLEYSYCGAIVTAWAGPSHWRLKNNRGNKNVLQYTTF